MRDNARKIHTDLVPFDDLSEAIKGLDYAVIDWLDCHLARRPSGLDSLGRLASCSLVLPENARRGDFRAFAQ